MLLQMRQRLIAARTFERTLAVIMDDVIALHGAEFGNIQLLVANELIIVAQRGFSAPFLKAFARTHKDDPCACGRVLKTHQTVIIPDVKRDAGFAPFRRIAREAGFRAVQSSPLLMKSGRLMGVISTHFANVHEPTKIEMETLAEYSVFAAERLTELAPSDSVPAKAKDLLRKITA